jgi:hypothetical protein
MQPPRNPSERPITVYRVIPASVIRRFRSDIARQKKSKKTPRLIKKENRDE